MGNLRKRKIGVKEFGGKINITDPCYDRDVWCRIDAEVKEGIYDCVVWRQTNYYEHNGEKYPVKTVSIIGIYLDGVIPQQNKMEHIGDIGVDAGLAGFFNNKPDYTDDEWEKFCKLIADRKKDAWINKEGFYSDSGNGDGYYPVYAYKKNNEITALEIRF